MTGDEAGDFFGETKPATLAITTWRKVAPRWGRRRWRRDRAVGRGGTDRAAASAARLAAKQRARSRSGAGGALERGALDRWEEVGEAVGRAGFAER